MQAKRPASFPQSSGNRHRLQHENTTPSALATQADSNHLTPMGDYRYTGGLARMETAEKPLQARPQPTASLPAAPPPTPDSHRGGLPDALKSGIASLSGISLDDVTVHYNSPQPAQLKALAYARGSDIHLAPGQARHLPHEAWHVVQQKQARVKPTLQLKGELPVNCDAGLEQEADVMGARALQQGLSSKPLAAMQETMPRGYPAFDIDTPAVLQGVFILNHETLDFPPRFYEILGAKLAGIYVTPPDLVDRMQTQADPQTGPLDLLAWLIGQNLVLQNPLVDPGMAELVDEAKRTLVTSSIQHALETMGALSFALAEGRDELPFDTPLGPKIWYSNNVPIMGRTPVKATGQWYTREQLKQLLEQSSSKSLFSGLQKYIDLLAAGSKFIGNGALFGTLQNIESLQLGEKPMAVNYPLIKIGEHWYARDQLEKFPSRYGITGLNPAALKNVGKLESGTEFGKASDLRETLNKLAQEQAALEQAKSEKERLKLEEEALAKSKEEQRRKNPFTTSMEGQLKDSETIEDDIGRRAATHPRSLGAADSMGRKVSAFIDAYELLVPGKGDELYASIGTSNRSTSGAVGQDPAKVKQALLSGTLQGRLTHIIAFRAILADLLLQDSANAQEAAKQAGFDLQAMKRLASGKQDAEHEKLLELKQSIVPGRDAVATNQKPLAEVGIPFSADEQALWHDPNIPEFEVGHTNARINPDHEWAKQTKALGFPFRSGPSTHTADIFEMRELLGLHDLALEDLKLAATGYLLPIGAHSLFEIQHTAEIFGADREITPLLYHKMLAELEAGARLAQQNGLQILNLFGSDVARFDDSALIKAHYYLLSHGYAFLGFHGADEVGVKGITQGGFDENFEKRGKDDPWRGVYFAPDTKTAMGYLGDGAGRLLRVYAPVPVLQAMVQARMPIDDVLSHNELAKRLKMQSFVPSEKDAIIMGRERSHADNEEEANSLEAVMSWSVAKQCIVLPSLHKAKAPSDAELGLPNQITVPSKLSFEGTDAGHSSGGLDLSRDTSGETDPSQWEPNAGFVSHQGPWEKHAYLDGTTDQAGPTRRQIEILRRVKIAARFGMSWREVGALSLPLQANAATLQEILPLIEHLHADSPAWVDFMQRFDSAKDISFISPGLYLSGWLAAIDTSWQAQNVGYVLNCCQFTFPEAVGVTYTNVNVVGYNNGLFDWASNKIEAARLQGVLVHCIEGKNRSATVLAAYLMKSERWDANKAIRFLTAQRPWAEPDRSALLAWEEYLVKTGFIKAPIRPSSSIEPSKPSSAKPPLSSLGLSPTFGDEDWALSLALRESLMDSVKQLSFESTGEQIGLDRYLILHNASGSYNNCLIYSIVGALGLTRTDLQVQAIGQVVRDSRVGVEPNGFLNAQAVPRILAELNRSATRVVIVDTTGKVQSKAVEGQDTYAAEIVNAGAADTIFIVNQRFIHFGYGRLRSNFVMSTVDQSSGDGNHWIRFASTALVLWQPPLFDSLNS